LFDPATLPPASSCSPSLTLKGWAFPPQRRGKPLCHRWTLLLGQRSLSLPLDFPHPSPYLRNRGFSFCTWHILCHTRPFPSLHSFPAGKFSSGGRDSFFPSNPKFLPAPHNGTLSLSLTAAIQPPLHDHNHRGLSRGLWLCAIVSPLINFSSSSQLAIKSFTLDSHYVLDGSPRFKKNTCSTPPDFLFETILFPTDYTSPL